MGWDHVGGGVEEKSKVIISVSIEGERLRFRRLFCIPAGPPGWCRSP